MMIAAMIVVAVVVIATLIAAVAVIGARRKRSAEYDTLRTHIALEAALCIVTVSCLSVIYLAPVTAAVS